jgi:hypothetical protein
MHTFAKAPVELLLTTSQRRVEFRRVAERCWVVWFGVDFADGKASWSACYDLRTPFRRVPRIRSLCAIARRAKWTQPADLPVESRLASCLSLFRRIELSCVPSLGPEVSGIRRLAHEGCKMCENQHLRVDDVASANQGLDGSLTLARWARCAKGMLELIAKSNTFDDDKTNLHYARVTASEALRHFQKGAES